LGRFGWEKPEYKADPKPQKEKEWPVSRKIGLGRPAKPGLGFMPFMAGLLLAGLSFSLVIQVLFIWTAPIWSTRVLWKNILSVLGAMAAYGFWQDEAGFVPVAFGFVALLMKVIEPQSWKRER